MLKLRFKRMILSIVFVACLGVGFIVGVCITSDPTNKFNAVVASALLGDSKEYPILGCALLLLLLIIINVFLIRKIYLKVQTDLFSAKSFVKNMALLFITGLSHEFAYWAAIRVFALAMLKAYFF